MTSPEGEFWNQTHLSWEEKRKLQTKKEKGAQGEAKANWGKWKIYLKPNVGLEEEKKKNKQPEWAKAGYDAERGYGGGRRVNSVEQAGSLEQNLPRTWSTATRPLLSTFTSSFSLLLPLSFPVYLGCLQRSILLLLSIGNWCLHKCLVVYDNSYWEIYDKLKYSTCK